MADKTYNFNKAANVANAVWYSLNGTAKNSMDKAKFINNVISIINEEHCIVTPPDDHDCYEHLVRIRGKWYGCTKCGLFKHL